MLHRVVVGEFEGAAKGCTAAEPQPLQPVNAGRKKKGEAEAAAAAGGGESGPATRGQGGPGKAGPGHRRTRREGGGALPERRCTRRLGVGRDNPKQPSVPCAGPPLAASEKAETADSRLRVTATRSGFRLPLDPEGRRGAESRAWQRRSASSGTLCTERGRLPTSSPSPLLRALRLPGSVGGATAP